MSATPADPRERDALVERFLDVICDDEELLAAEFEAIIAAGWRPVRPTWPGAEDVRRPQAGSHPLDRLISGAGSSESIGIPARARQRSPPADR